MAKVMTSKEVEERYGLSADLIDRWAEDAEKGVFHGEPRETVYGRPLMFGEQMRQVGFKEPLGRIELIDARASQLGMRRSEYLRHLVDQDLGVAGLG